MCLDGFRGTGEQGKEGRNKREILVESALMICTSRPCRTKYVFIFGTLCPFSLLYIWYMTYCKMQLASASKLRPCCFSFNLISEHIHCFFPVTFYYTILTILTIFYCGHCVSDPEFHITFFLLFQNFSLNTLNQHTAQFFSMKQTDCFLVRRNVGY